MSTVVTIPRPETIPMTPHSLYVLPETLDALRQLANTDGRTVTAFVRHLLEEATETGHAKPCCYGKLMSKQHSEDCTKEQ